MYPLNSGLCCFLIRPFPLFPKTPVKGDKGVLKSIFTNANRFGASHTSEAPSLLPADVFLRTLRLECKRTERSRRAFVLMILDVEPLLQAAKNGRALPKLVGVLQSVRDTDIKGWYKNGASIGVIFTEIGEAVEKSSVRTLANRVTDALYASLSIEEVNNVRLSFHIFPQDWDEASDWSDPKTSSLRCTLGQEVPRKKTPLHVKRTIDVVGSLAALLFFLPLMVVIAVAIKATSRGPVLFRQSRVGQYGRKFTFLKFRSMYVSADSAIHEKYVKAFIAGNAETHANGQQTKVFKLTADPRVTGVGGFLRKTSLDELPQFLNVLQGEMSLVGPRPPVCYEVERYSLWHRRRLLAVKPGITGLWQVEGRSRVTFDEMVRLDIRYARTWSLWLDLKILAQTPNAVISGNGAC
jgi:exopolysaccharide biosynthesis polyprenyl glycosylphosphotransferase